MILVTGALRGIGRAIVEELLECHNDTSIVVVVPSRGSISDLEEKYKLRIAIVEGDLKEAKTNILAVDMAMKQYGRLDSLILNAGIIEPVGNIVDVNLKRAIPHLRESCGRVLLISSGASIKPYQSIGAYSGSKIAMNHLSAVLVVFSCNVIKVLIRKKQAAEENLITSISIRPGVVDTQMQTFLRETYASKLDEVTYTRFMDIYNTGQLMHPRKIGSILANFTLNAKKELSGKFVSHDDDELMHY
ncbi:hypothetical protein PCK1_003146 [Pneumocystis canis]|nr:hypothetical protein PCK1_003146 [Pneumocystis canis]